MRASESPTYHSMTHPRAELSQGPYTFTIVENFTIDSVFCANFQIGACVSPSGVQGSSTAVTQYGAIINLTTRNTKFPVQASYRTSSINLYGGDVECNLTTAGVGVGSIGLDISTTNHNTSIDDGGEWGIFGTHVLNCDTAISLNSSAAFQDYAILEQTGSWATFGTGVAISVISSSVGHSGGTVIAGDMTSFSTGISIGSNVSPITISATFQSVSTPVSGSTNNSVVLSPSVASNLPIGLTLGQPGPGGTTGALTFANSTTANTIEITPAAPGGNRVYTIPDSGAGTGNIALTAGTLTAGDGAIFDGNGNLTDSGIAPYAVGTGGEGFLFLPSITQPTSSGANTPFSGTASQVRAIQFTLPYKITINKISTYVNTSSTGSFNLGIYSADGSSKLLDTGAITCNGGNQTFTLGTSLVLQPGAYFFAFAATGTTCAAAGIGGPLNSGFELIMNNNATITRFGTAGSLMSGSLPSSLTVTAASFGIPVAFAEP